MNKQERYDAYVGSVGPGWWWLLDKCIDKCRAIDSTCTFEFKEKFGRLRFYVLSDTDANFDVIIEHAETESASICECCGAPGKVRNDRSYIETLCDRCAAIRKNPTEKRRVFEDTTQRWMKE